MNIPDSVTSQINKEEGYSVPVSQYIRTTESNNFPYQTIQTPKIKNER